VIYLWYFFVACLIGGFFSVLVGLIQFGDEYKSRNWFFIGALLFLVPIVIALILFTIDQIKVSSSYPGAQHIPYGWIFFELIVIAVLLISCFGSAEDRAARNKTLGCSVFLFIQLLFLLFFFTMMFAMMEPPVWRDYDAKIEDFGYKEEAGQITITAYLGKEKIAEIPSAIDGKSVTKIAYSAFSENGSITGVVIPESVKTIDRGAFYECYSLTSITIPDSVTSIGENPFSYCNALTEINISSGNPNYSSEEGILYSKDKQTIIACPAGKSGSVQLPDTVTYIGEDAFRGCSDITSITIPDSVTSIGAAAFHNCSSLTTLTIPYGVTDIVDSAFGGCSLLTSISIPDSVTRIGDWSFSGCHSLTNITIPENVISIGEYAFDGCLAIKNITIPDSVISIGDQAFRECNSLTTITIPKSVTSIGVSLFFWCENMTDIQVSSDNPNYSGEAGILYNKDMTAVVCCPPAKSGTVLLPDGVTSISERAFDGCSSLTSITISDSVTSIGIGAFINCKSLTTITIPDSVTSIGEQAFQYCEKAVIQCREDSYAHRYAVENKIEYVIEG
jgi:hypothetical protein